FVSDSPDRALPDAKFACVCLFGVLHHVPGEDARSGLLHAARSRVAPGGVLAFTLWRFDRDPRAAQRRLSESELDSLAGLPATELEAGDALLRFGERGDAVRYCHLIDDAELARLLASLGLELEPLDRFSADGTSGDLNDYLVL